MVWGRDDNSVGYEYVKIRVRNLYGKYKAWNAKYENATLFLKCS